MNINNFEPFDRPNPLHDYFFYKVMGEKGDEVQLLGFLNAVLGRSGKERIESLVIMENRSFIKKTKDGKSCFLDVLAVLQDGTKVNIEVQLSNQHNMERRSLFYWSEVYLESLDEGQDYRELPDVIAVNIVDFDFPPGGGFHTCFHLREDSDPSLVLTTALEIHNINMVKWRKLKGKDVKSDPLHRWLAWFDQSSPPELIAEVVSMDGAVAQAYRKLEEARRDQEDYRAYWAERKFEHDMVSRLGDAREDGKETKATEIARKMKEMGFPIAQIATATGLSPEAVEQL